MTDIIFIFLFLLFLMVFIFFKNKISLFKIFLLILIVFFIFQYILINSNPYKDFKTNKLTILNYIPNQYKPISEYYNPKKKYKYPFILKPVSCTRSSKDVKVIYNKYELRKYLYKKNLNEIMYQEFIETPYEVGILYERNPLFSSGKIKSIVMRKFLKKNNIEMKKVNGVYNHEDFVNLDYLITPKLNSIIDNISHNIPNFYVGRFDIRFYNIGDLNKGKFYILEANGTMGFDLTKDCYQYPLLNSYVWINIKLRWLLVRLYYGLINIFTLNCVRLDIIFLSIYNFFKCFDEEKLFCVYS